MVQTMLAAQTRDDATTLVDAADDAAALDDLFTGPVETSMTLAAFADFDSNNRVTLRSAGRQTARQRTRTRRAAAALRQAHASFMRRMDDYYPDDEDYRRAADNFIDLCVRAIDGDTDARTRLAGYLGIDTDAVFGLISTLTRDQRDDQAAVIAAIRAVLALAAVVPATPAEPIDTRQRTEHLRDVTRSVAPLHGPTSHAMTRSHHRRVMAAA